MEQKLETERYLRNIGETSTRSRNLAIQKIMVSYGYDYTNAEKVYEIMRVRQVETFFGLACGAVAAYKVAPFQRELAASFAIFRKPWMQWPLMLGAFGFAYHVSVQLPVRLFSKLSHRTEGQTEETFRGEADLVGRFRLNETSSSSSAEDALLDKLAMYSKDPLTKPELLSHMVKRLS